MLPADEALPAWGPRCGRTLGSGRLAPEDPHGPDHDQLEERPADEREDGRDIEHRTTRREVILVEDAVERRDEDLADIEDARDERVAGAGVEQEQDNARPDDDLDQPEQEDDDPPGHLGGPGARPRDVATVRPRRFLARGHRGILGDDCPVDLIGHGFLLCDPTRAILPLESPLKGAPRWQANVTSPVRRGRASPGQDHVDLTTVLPERHAVMTARHLRGGTTWERRCPGDAQWRGWSPGSCPPSQPVFENVGTNR